MPQTLRPNARFGHFWQVDSVFVFFPYYGFLSYLRVKNLSQSVEQSEFGVHCCIVCANRPTRRLFHDKVKIFTVSFGQAYSIIKNIFSQKQKTKKIGAFQNG